MDSNEAARKLEEYRAKKKREALINHYKEEVKSILKKFTIQPQKQEVETESTRNLLNEPPAPDYDSDAASNDDYDSTHSEEPACLTAFDYIQYSLWFILWVTLYSIFIKLEFGTVYFIVSLLVALYFNTRTGPKKRNEISAYSVFNRNCQSIDGTLDADKLTREMVYGVFSK